MTKRPRKEKLGFGSRYVGRDRNLITVQYCPTVIQESTRLISFHNLIAHRNQVSCVHVDIVNRHNASLCVCMLLMISNNGLLAFVINAIAFNSTVLLNYYT